MEIANNFKGLISSPEQGLAMLTRYGPPVATAILVALIGWLLAMLTLTLLPKPLPTSAPGAATPARQAASGPADINVQAIVRRHLFGVPPVKPAAEDVKIDNSENIEEIKDSQIKLIGTLASNVNDRSLAIIEVNNDAKVYSIGDSIRSQMTLDQVLAKEVIVIDKGQPKKLLLPRENEDGGSSSSTNRRVASRNVRSQRRAAPARVEPAQVQAGARSITDLIRPQPVFANGKQRGYRVYPGRQRDQFTALGLKAGDLVTEINGTPLDDPARGKDVFASLASASQIQVTIERNGAPTSLVLDTSQLGLSGN